MKELRIFKAVIKFDGRVTWRLNMAALNRDDATTKVKDFIAQQRTILGVPNNDDVDITISGTPGRIWV